MKNLIEAKGFHYSNIIASLSLLHNMTQPIPTALFGLGKYICIVSAIN